MARVSRPSVDLTALAHELGKGRDALLNDALTEAIKLCPAPDVPVDPKRRSDQHWMHLFSQCGGPISSADTRVFLRSFQLETQFVGWDGERVASRIVALRSEVMTDASTTITGLASELAAYLTRGAGIQTSAASKIIFFAKPQLHAYIWDQHARRAACFRHSQHAGPSASRPALANPYTGPGVHHYDSFWTDCAEALRDELSRTDFQAAVARFRQALDHAGGPMTRASTVGDPRFIERRLLDKLLFFEGRRLKALLKESRALAA